MGVKLLALLALVTALRCAGALQAPHLAPEAAGRHVVVIGAGYSGLTAACELRMLGYDVTVVDMMSAPGGRAQRVTHPGGFVHDAGPSWYWMPELFDDVLARFGTRRSDHYNLTLLDPAYRLVFGEGAGESLDVPGTLTGFFDMARKLDPEHDMAGFFADGELKYDVGVRRAIWEVPTWPLPLWMLSRGVTPALVTTSLRDHIARFTTSATLRTVLEWPSLFLGLDAAVAPSLYAMLSWSGHAQGTWLPDPDGMAAPAVALYHTATALGVAFQLNTEVTRIEAVDRRRVTRVHTVDHAHGGAVSQLAVDGIVASADYEHVEQHLLPADMRRHAASFWEKQIMTPGAVVFTLCVSAPVPSLPHTHSLFLDDPTLPFYASSDVARSGELSANQTSVFVLVPLGEGPVPPHADLLSRVLARLGIPVAHVVCGAEGYGPQQYTDDFHAYRGNAFGLANTLSQTLWLKPAMDSLAANLVYAGHLTHPGPGVPPALVSGILAAQLLHANMHPPTLASPHIAAALLLLVLLVAATACARSAPCRAALALHRSGRTYFAAASAMPLAEFSRIAALYAAFRRADDLVDCVHADVGARRADLDDLAARTLASKQGCLGYPTQLWEKFFAAMRADASQSPLVCATHAQLMEYMDGSAAVLGEFMLVALGGDPGLVAPARALGYAFQLTNMLRDVVEDGEMGRQYIPVDACQRHGITCPLHQCDPTDPRYRALMEEMFALADGWYSEADVGIAALPARTRPAIALARTVYHRLHAAIRQAGYTLTPRVVVPWSSKLAHACTMLPASSVAAMLAAEAAMCVAGVLCKWGLTVACLLCVWLATELVEVSGEVSYLLVHAMWTLPTLALLALLWVVRCARRPGYVGHRTDASLVPKWAAVLVVVALVYTTPWDSYLIARRVWASSASAVVGTLALIPLEEYAFFVIATLTSCGAWVVSWPSRWNDVPRTSPHPAVTAALLATFAMGAVAASMWDRTLYLGLLLLWATPVLTLQWCVGGHVLAAHGGHLARTIILSGGVLALIDRWAIRRNVWVLNPEFSLPHWGGGIHPEEVLFFFLTGAMCACGLTLAVWAEHGFQPQLRVGQWTLARRTTVGAHVQSAATGSAVQQEQMDTGSGEAAMWPVHRHSDVVQGDKVKIS